MLKILFIIFNCLLSNKQDDLKKNILNKEYRRALDELVYYDDLFSSVPIYKSEKEIDKVKKNINARNFILGYLYYINSEYDLAEPFLIKALEDGLNIKDYIYGILSDNCYKKNDNNCRLKYNNKLISVYEDEKDVVISNKIIAKAYYDNSEIFIFKKDYKTAINYIDKYLKLKTDKPYIMLLLKANCYENLNKNKEAVGIYKNLWLNYHNKDIASIIEEKIKHYSINFNWNEKLSRINNIVSIDGYEEGIKEFSFLDRSNLEALSSGFINKDEYRSRKNLLKYNVGYMKYMLKDYNSSLRIFKELIADNYINEKIIYYLALNYRRLDDYESSVVELNKLIKNYPHSGSLAFYYYIVGLSFKKLNRVTEAIPYFKYIIEKIKRTQYLDDAYWELGFLYYTIRDYTNAIEYLSLYHENVGESYFNYGKALFWIARCHIEAGNKNKALEIFKNIIQKYPFSYYSLLTLSYAYKDRNLFNIIKSFFVPKTIIKFEGNSDYDFESKINAKRYYFRANLFLELGLKDFAKNEITKFFSKNQTNNKQIKELAKLLFVVGDYNKASYIMEIFYNLRTFFNDVEMYQDELIMTYPEAFSEYVYEYSNLYDVDPFLTFSIMKAESMFREAVRSPVGAIGLMQLMNYTAANVAMKTNYGILDEDDLEIPKVNVSFGTFYLKKLLKEFNGYLPLVISSYNAGPHKVNKWFELIGTKKMDVFIEGIPYEETQTYVKKVLSYIFAYNFLYSNDENYFIIDLDIPEALLVGPYSAKETW